MEVSMINQSRLPTINDFFKLPNPSIFTLFITSSSATFFLGVAMAVYWALYGHSHPGFHWLVYYVPVLIILPVLIWIIFLLAAAILPSLPLSTLLSESKPQINGDRRTDEMEKEVVLDKKQCDVAEVQIRIHGNSVHPIGKTETQILKRTLSVPRTKLLADHSKFKRSLSFHY